MDLDDKAMDQQDHEEQVSLYLVTCPHFVNVLVSRYDKWFNYSMFWKVVNKGIKHDLSSFVFIVCFSELFSRHKSLENDLRERISLNAQVCKTYLHLLFLVFLN
jgi:hypothetical protein